MSRKDFIASIRWGIASGKWPPGSVLPTSERLAAEYDVGLTMVNAVMQTLIETGEITSRPGGQRRVAGGDASSENTGEIHRG